MSVQDRHLFCSGDCLRTGHGTTPWNSKFYEFFCTWPGVGRKDKSKIFASKRQKITNDTRVGWWILLRVIWLKTEPNGGFLWTWKLTLVFDKPWQITSLFEHIPSAPEDTFCLKNWTTRNIKQHSDFIFESLGFKFRLHLEDIVCDMRPCSW